MYIIEIILLSIGLAMDASAVSMTNGFNEPKMKISKIILIACFFGVFQAIMPFIGYLAGSIFTNFISKFTPWLALVLLSFIGGGMLIDGIKKQNDVEKESKLTIKMLTVQAFATSIDALAVGLIFIGQEITTVILAVTIIGVITFILSFGAVYLGKKFGSIFENKAKIVGGLILIGIGLKIFIDYLINLS